MLRVSGGMARRSCQRMAAVLTPHRQQALRRSARRVVRRGRRVLAGGLGPVLAAALLVPVSIVAVVSVARPAPAKAAGPPVLVLLQNGESTAPETTILQNAGYTVTQATPSTWAGMSAAQFGSYAALVIGDPSSGGTCSSSLPTTGTLGTAWQSAVSGNIAVLGAAPAAAGTSAAGTLVKDAAGYAAAAYNLSGPSGTGLYLSLNCAYSLTSTATAVALLNGVAGIGTAGGVQVTGGFACGDSGTVNTWEAHASGTFGAFTSASLGPSSWPSPACPVEEGFTSWPAMFTPVAYDGASDAAKNFTASDGAAGQPYILLGAPVSAATQALAPSTYGEVPGGSTAGGAANPAAPGLSQSMAGDPVNTENGDFTESATDFSIPGYGPALAFSRTYDAQVAQQQTATGTPGAMGYGWTDNWASSLSAASPVPGDIYTLAGLRTDTGQGGPPASAALNNPVSVYVNGSDVYFADMAGNRVEEIPGTSKTQWGISMTAGDIYTVAGNDAGQIGGSANGTPAKASFLHGPVSVAMDSAGDLFIVDSYNSRVVEIPATSKTMYGIPMTAGDVYVVAGTGQQGLGGDKIVATSSALSSPGAMYAASNGDLYIADSGNNRVQEVAAAGENEWNNISMTAGDVYTVAGSASGTAGNSGTGGLATSALLNAPQAVYFNSTGLYIADGSNARIAEVPAASGGQWGITSMTANDLYTIAGRNGQPALGGDNKLATQSDLNTPTAVTVAGGNLFIADTNNNRIQEVAGSGQNQFGQNMTADFVYTVAGNANGTVGDSGDGGAALSAYLDAPYGVALDSSGNLLLTDTLNNEVRKVSASTDVISDFAGGAGGFAQDGDNGPAATSGLNGPQQEAFDAKGDIYIADAASNRVQEIASYSHAQFGITMTAGDIYTVAGQASGQTGSPGDGGPATQAYLYDPLGVALDAAGDLYIADNANNRIQEVPAASGTQWGQAMTAGDMYTIAGSSAGTAGNTGDGAGAASALLNAPVAVAVDGAGNIYIADRNNNQVREVAIAGGPQWGQSMSAGDIYTIAGSTSATAGTSGDGGPAASGLLNQPEAVALDGAGNLYISDTSNNRIQEIAAATGTQHGQPVTGGDVYTIAGSATGTAGVTGDGGPATAARLHGPNSLAASPAGDLYIADSANNRIQEIPAASGTQWGQAMTGGGMYTIGGSPAGASGNSGDGGPATSALMTSTQSVSLDPQGNLYVTDNANNAVREITSATAGAIPPAPGQTSAVLIAPAGTAPGGLTITQPGGAQITFYAKSGGNCTSPYVAAGQYCTLPQYTGAALAYNAGTSTYTFAPFPRTSFTYNGSGQLASESDAAGDTLTVSYNTPAPGSGNCPSSAAKCETVTAASGRALVIGTNSPGQVTSVTDPLGRQQTYTYTGNDLTSAKDPMGDVTSYTYGAGSTGNPQLANNLLTITKPNAQPGGPDAGDSTVNVYDALGRVTSQTDPMGWKTILGYTGYDPATGTGVIRIADPDGNTTVDDYTNGTLAAVSNWTGSTLTSEEDYGPDTTAGGTSGGTLLDAWTSDGDGNTTTNTYDSAGNVTSTTDPLGNQTTQASTSLDQADCSTTAEASSGCPSAAGPTPVSPGGVITPPSSAPPQGVTWALYDTDGDQLYSTTGVYQPGAGSASYLQTTYSLYKGNSVTLNGKNISCTASPPSVSLPCAKINADGVVTQLAYNSAGDQTSSSTPDGNGSELATTTYTYDTDGEQTAATSPDGNLSGANAANYTTTTSSNADGQKTAVIKAGGTGATVTPRTTSYGYDGDGNQTTVQDARGYETTTIYNADDESTLVTNPDNDATLTCYDGDGKVTQTVPASGVAAGSLTAASCPSSYPSGYGDRLAADATTYTFDANGDKTATTTPAPAGQTGYETTTYTDDADGNPLTTSAPPAANGGSRQVTVDTYDAADQLATNTTGYGTSAASTTSYCYNPDGEQTSVVAPDGNANGVAPCENSSPWVVSAGSNPVQAAYQTTTKYDSSGDQVSTTSPANTVTGSNGATTTYTYDPEGNTLSATSPDGVTTTWTYTPSDQPATMSFSASSAHAVNYGYDAEDDLTSMTDATGTTTWVYDPFGEVTSETNGAGSAVSYGYNADGQTSSVTYPLPASATWAASDTVDYGYDHADALSSVTDFNGHQLVITDTADGLPSAVSLGSTGDTITTSYDNADEPSQIALKNSASTLDSFSYSTAPAGNVLTENDLPSSAQFPASYTYDTKSRVTSMTPGTGSTLNYGYDASGNLTTLPTRASGTYNAASELTSSVLSGSTPSYTYNANGDRLAATQGSTTSASGTWNGADQLTSYSSGAASMTAATYDGTGLRASVTSTPSGGSPVTQQFVWGPSDGLLQDSTNAYIYAGSGTPSEQVSLSTGATGYLVTDMLGSVRGVVSSAGALISTTAYDAWGNPETPGGLTADTPFGFAGGYTDPSGLIYLIHRYYDPQTGQFLSVDPDIAQTGDPYGYSGGDPVNMTDPTGDRPKGYGYAFLIGRTFTWRGAEDFAASFACLFGCERGVGLNTGLGRRVVDIAAWGVGEVWYINEVKTGYQPGRKALQIQADKDDWLLNHGGGCNSSVCYTIGGGTWWFLPSKITTLSGSSASFYQRLSNDGINILLFVYRKGKGGDYNNTTADNYAMWYAAESHQRTQRVYDYYPTAFTEVCPAGDFWVY